MTLRKTSLGAFFQVSQYFFQTALQRYPKSWIYGFTKCFSLKKNQLFCITFLSCLSKFKPEQTFICSRKLTLLLQFEMKLEGCWSYHISFTETAATRTGCSSLNHFIYSTDGISYSHTSQKLVPSVISLEARV